MKKPVFAVYLGPQAYQSVLREPRVLSLLRRRVEDEAEVTFGDYHDSRMASGSYIYLELACALFF